MPHTPSHDPFSDDATAARRRLRTIKQNLGPFSAALQEDNPESFASFAEQTADELGRAAGFQNGVTIADPETFASFIGQSSEQFEAQTGSPSPIRSLSGARSDDPRAQAAQGLTKMEALELGVFAASPLLMGMAPYFASEIGAELASEAVKRSPLPTPVNTALEGLLAAAALKRGKITPKSAGLGFFGGAGIGGVGEALGVGEQTEQLGAMLSGGLSGDAVTGFGFRGPTLFAGAGRTADPTGVRLPSGRVGDPSATVAAIRNLPRGGEPPLTVNPPRRTPVAADVGQTGVGNVLQPPPRVQQAARAADDVAGGVQDADVGLNNLLNNAVREGRITTGQAAEIFDDAAEAFPTPGVRSRYRYQDAVPDTAVDPTAGTAFDPRDITDIRQLDTLPESPVRQRPGPGQVQLGREDIVDLSDPRIAVASEQPGWLQEFAAGRPRGAWVRYETESGGSLIGRIGPRGEIIPEGVRGVREQTTYRGPRVGEASEDALAAGRSVNRGADALVERIELERNVRGLPELGERGISPEVADAAITFIRSMPEDVLEGGALSFRNVRSFGADNERVVAGFYDTEDSLANIALGALNKSVDPNRLIIHEVSHHIERFLGNDAFRALQQQYRRDLADGGERLLFETQLSDVNRQAFINRLEREARERLTPSEYTRWKDGENFPGVRRPPPPTSDIAQRAKDSYRFTNFNEWFAEVLSDKALRDFYKEVWPEAPRNAFLRAIDLINSFAIGVRNILLRNNRPDAAERVYQDLIAGTVRRVGRQAADQPRRQGVFNLADEAGGAADDVTGRGSSEWWAVTRRIEELESALPTGSVEPDELIRLRARLRELEATPAPPDVTGGAARQAATDPRLETAQAGDRVTVFDPRGNPVEVTVTARSEAGTLRITLDDGTEELLGQGTMQRGNANSPDYILENIGKRVEELSDNELRSYVIRTNEKIAAQTGSGTSESTRIIFVTDLNALTLEARRRGLSLADDVSGAARPATPATPPVRAADEAMGGAARQAPLTPAQQLEADIAALRQGDDALPTSQQVVDDIKEARRSEKQSLTPGQQLDADIKVERELQRVERRSGVAARRSIEAVLGTQASAEDVAQAVLAAQTSELASAKGARAVRNLLDTTVPFTDEQKVLRAEQVKAGVGVGRGRAASVVQAGGDPVAEARAYRSGQIGRTSRGQQFEALAEVADPDQAGDLPRLTPTELAEEVGLTGDVIEAMHATIRRRFVPVGQEWDADAAQVGLIRMLLGEAPTDSQRKLLRQVFGAEFTDSLPTAGKGRLGRAGEILFDVSSLLPKAIRGSMELSAFGRQLFNFTFSPRRAMAAGRTLNVGRRLLFGRNVRVNAAKHYDEVISNDIAVRHGLYDGPNKVELHDTRGGARLQFTDREEEFASNLIDLLPEFGREVRSIFGRTTHPVVRTGIRAATLPIRLLGKGVERSQLSFGGMMNQMRGEVGTKTLRNWEKVAEETGRQITPAELDALKGGINVVTGRGNLGGLSEGKIGKTLHVLFWAPRLAVGRIQTLGLTARAGGELGIEGIARLAGRDFRANRARQVLATDVVSSFVTGATILGLMKATGVAEVETNPNSSDFGKGRIGRQRFDFWGGYQPVMRYIAQIATNEKKSPVTGESRPIGYDRNMGALITLGNFLRAKAGPGATSIALNENAQKNFIGEDLSEATALFGRDIGPTISRREREIMEQVVPLFHLDLLETIQDQGLIRGAIFGTGGFLGGGLQNFPAPDAPAPEEDLAQFNRPRILGGEATGGSSGRSGSSGGSGNPSGLTPVGGGSFFENR